MSLSVMHSGTTLVDAMVAPHWGIVQLEEGRKVEAQEGTRQGGSGWGENGELGGIYV